ncbi:hypothetical protein BJX76DRAFT_354809 [Aspergillus varians]
MADTLDLVGAIGTWAAILLALLALAGIIPAYILYRVSQTNQYEALSVIDDRSHEYISKGYALLPGKGFFRSTMIPNLASPSLTSWVNFADILRAYGIDLPRDGKLKTSGTEALLPVHRSWILLLGLVDRYGRHKDSGLFIDAPSDPEWSVFGKQALYGLSGVLERIRPGQDRICFRMHSVDHMRSMPRYIPKHDVSLRNLFFLYLGYLPASDGSLYCSALESNSVTTYRTIVPRDAYAFYKMNDLNVNKVPVRHRRLADEMGITFPKIYKLGLYQHKEQGVTTGHTRGLLEDVQYFGLRGYERARSWLHPEVRSMILALLQLDLNEQSCLCGPDLQDFFERVLPRRDMGYLPGMVSGIDMLRIQDADKKRLRKGA